MRLRSLAARDAGAEDEHLGRRDRAGGGHQERKQARQPVGGDDRRLVAGDRALRRQRVHGLRARRAGDRLHRERNDPSCGQPFDPLRVAQRRQKPDQDRPGLELGDLVGRRPAHADDGARAGEQVGAGDDVGARRRVLVVGEPAAMPASRSTAKVKPEDASLPTASGTSATLRSPAPVSFGTATLTKIALYEARRRRGREPVLALESRALWDHCSLPSQPRSRPGIHIFAATPPASP